jgi:hypothetical protein
MVMTMELVMTFLTVGLLLAVGAVAFLGRRTASELRMALDEQTARVMTLERNFGAVLACSRGLANRFENGQRLQQTLQKQLDKLKHQGGDENQLAVQHAMKLIRGGASLDEVKDVCELTAGEAEILESLARHRAVA